MSDKIYVNTDFIIAAIDCMSEINAYAPESIDAIKRKYSTRKKNDKKRRNKRCSKCEHYDAGYYVKLPFENTMFHNTGCPIVRMHTKPYWHMACFEKGE